MTGPQPDQRRPVHLSENDPRNTIAGPWSGKIAEEADMTVHRSRLHRSARRRCARPEHGAGAHTPERATVPQRLFARLSSEQGDVPGWVLITLMTAGIVVALWAVASDQIVQIFQNAMAPFLSGSL
ncbi:MAG: hypothetical protein ACTHV2_02150 [Brachybacterium sp.]